MGYFFHEIAMYEKYSEDDIRGNCMNSYAVLLMRKSVYVLSVPVKSLISCFFVC